jgi:hypothetical protein
MLNKLLLAATLLTATATHAQTQQAIRVNCIDTKILYDTLTKEHGEQPLLYGRGPEGSTGIMNLWVNGTTLTWTIVVTNTDGTSCIIGNGRELTIRPTRSQKSL